MEAQVVTTTSLDELVRLWGETVRPVLVADLDEWTSNTVLDFGLTVTECQIRFFEYTCDEDDGLVTHWVGLFGAPPTTENTSSVLDELVRLWGTRVRETVPDPESIIAEIVLTFEIATKPQISLFDHISAADGGVHRVGLLVDCEADIKDDGGSRISSLDEFLNVVEVDESLVGSIESMISDMLEFSLTATEKEKKFFEHITTGGARHRFGLLGKDVRQGRLVVKLLGKEWYPTIPQLTSKCLANLAGTHESRVEIASLPGVLHSLLRLLQDNDSVHPIVLEQTARCLCQLAIASDNQVRIASHPGMMAALVGLLLGARSPAVMQKTSKCVTHLAESRQNQVTITSYPGALDALVRLSGQNWSPGLREQAVTCLNNLTILQENQVKIVSHPGVLGALVSLLGDKETKQVQLYSMKCLNNLASHHNKVDIASCPGLLDTLVRKLKSNWATSDRIRVQEGAARCLLSLAAEYKHLMKITVHPGVLDALVRCLGKYTTHRVQNLAAECIRDLAADFGNHGKIATHPGALAAILRMLVQDMNPRGQEVAAWCLNKLASTLEARNIIASRQGVLEALVNLLKAGPGSITLQPTISCIASLALVTDKQGEMVSQTNVLEELVRLLGQDVDSSVLEQAARCLSLLASAPENQVKIVSYPGALDELRNLLTQNRTNRVLEQTAKCLTNLAENQENQVRIASSPGLLQALVPLLGQNVMPNVQEETLTCLAKLSESQENRVKIISCASDALLRLTATNTVDFSAQEQAIRCLENLGLSSVSSYTYAGVKNGRVHNTIRNTTSRQHDPSPCDADPVYLDPLTHDMMCDPVKCPDDRTYDRWTVLDRNMSSLRRLNDPTHGNRAFEIVEDDFHVRERLFEAFPEQEVKCFDRRRKYREEALQHALIGEFEDAKEKLSSVLKWAPEDIECQRELERILNVLEQSIDPDRWDMDPLTYDRMCDPVKCNDGRTYDRWTIIDRDLIRCPYDSNLKCFGILVDDLNVRRRLFEEYPEQEDIFRSCRISYREEALRHAQNGEFNDAIRKLRNVLKWAPTDRVCGQELNKSLSRLREQAFRMRVLKHEDVVKQAKRDYMDKLALPMMVLLVAAGICFVVESGWVCCELQFWTP
ncbi:unnamed protein product [Calypogeia fissa]